MMSSTAVAPVAPIVPSLRGIHRQNWLVLPGWGQSAAHWVPTTRWLHRAGVAVSWVDMGRLATTARGERGSVERLLVVAEQISRFCNEYDYSALVAHSAAAPVAVAVGVATGPRPRITLIEPVPSQFGLVPPAAWSGDNGRPGTASELPRRQRLDELYPFASQEVLRQIAVATGSPYGESLSPASLGDPGQTAGRSDWVRVALARLRAPLHVIRGAASAVCAQHLAEELCTHAPEGSRVDVLDRAGHSPHVDRPQRMAELLTAASWGDSDTVRHRGDMR